MYSTFIEQSPHLRALADSIISVAERTLDPSLSLMYYIDTVPASALEPLATQFGVMGYRGWLLARTETARRTLVKNALLLRRRDGTPGAIKTAILSTVAGVLNVRILKGVGLLYDGSFDYDGAQDFGGGFWANFSVVLEVDGTFDDSAGALADITQMILAWKNERSNLVDVIIEVTA